MKKYAPKMHYFDLENLSVNTKHVICIFTSFCESNCWWTPIDSMKKFLRIDIFLRKIIVERNRHI